MTQSILDGSDALIATGVTAGFGALWTTGLVVAGLADGDAAVSDVGFSVAVGSAVFGLLASAVVPAALVALDPATE